MISTFLYLTEVVHECAAAELAGLVGDDTTGVLMTNCDSASMPAVMRSSGSVQVTDSRIP
jgi:hypothetical protein